MATLTFKPATHLARGCYTSAEDLVNIIKNKIADIKVPGDVTAWMDICRTARQPQMLWHVDYVEPREALISVNELIRESEEILYGSKTKIQLKAGYTADVQQESAFNTIRAHLRSEEGDFDSALDIFHSLLGGIYDKLTAIRQSNLLMHCCLAFVCCGKFRDSHECFKRHWVLLKSLPEDERLGLGIWDNHVILHMIYWHIASNVRDFRDFYEVESGVESGIMSHKKVALLKCLDYDQTWVASFMGLPFHRQLCKLFPTFLPWDKRTTTPENFLELWETNPGASFKKEKKGALPSEMKYYERYNKQFLPHTRPDEDEAENCLYSYYFFQDSKAEETTLQDRLNMFMDKHLDTVKSKILSVGPGLAYPYQHHGKNITIVDISEHVCQRLEKIRSLPNKSGITIVHKCMSKYIRETNETFDVCIARDVLQNLSRSRLDVFLNYLPKKCNHLIALIDLSTDVRSDILSGSSFDQEVVLHKSILTAEEWIVLLQLGFEVSYEVEGCHLYVCAKSKN